MSSNAYNTLRLALSSALGDMCTDSLMRYLEAEGVFEGSRLDADRLEQALRSVVGEGAVSLLRAIMIKKVP